MSIRNYARIRKLRPIRYLRHGIDSKLINYFTGNSKTVEKTMEVGFTCTAPPKKRVVCNTMMRKDRIDIPYVMTWSHQRLDGKLKNQLNSTKSDARSKNLFVNSNA